MPCRTWHHYRSRQVLTLPSFVASVAQQKRHLQFGVLYHEKVHVRVGNIQIADVSQRNFSLSKVEQNVMKMMES